ncbi:hypothetical protein DH2020_001411 [Rehmannia glutinosa]|uniref:Uncharacterized protein n=1 Tax=Rehmannia glutinosa TaxID=99300 RepID=A0ABR0XZ94_REHGL
MVDLQFSTLLLFSIISPLLFFLLSTLINPCTSTPTKIPSSYPILGSIFAIWKNKERRVQWISDIVTSTPNLTFTLHRPFGYRQIFTANAANVQHILKSHFHNYHKGEVFRRTLRDFLGDGIFNADGENWKFQRQVSSHQFNTKSLKNFVEHVVGVELSDRLVPILKNAAENNNVLDFQDVLQRFAFDNICKIAFGYDPAYLTPSLPDAKFAGVFDNALKRISERFNSNIPFVWKIKRALCIGTERDLKITVQQVREFASEIIREKKQEYSLNESNTNNDLLSRFLSSGHKDEVFVTDIVISFILAGRDTTSAALTWFFWLVSKNPGVENEIIKEIRGNNSEGGPIYDEVKNMVYTHASLCESMRLYPPVPVSTKSAVNDDVLPDGTVVKRGTRISYHPYAMGRVEKVWGADWAEFRPERWLEWEETAGKWSFVGRDSFTYPVFQAGPRICLGKEMAFLQMKRVVAGVLRRFRVVPAVEGMEPVYVSDFTTKMKGGFPVKIEERVDH